VISYFTCGNLLVIVGNTISEVSYSLGSTVELKVELSYSATFELLGSFALQIQDSFMTLLDVTFDGPFGTLTLVLFSIGDTYSFDLPILWFIETWGGL
jgi:hypothetical protein